jgi:hypothetical protein
MSKPFDKELAKKAEEKTKELVKALNNTLKKYEALFGPQKDHDIAIICKNNKEIIIYVDVEVVRPDRWKLIKSCKYPTVRWPIAKKKKCEEKYKDKLAIMMSVNENDVKDMFYIDCETWISKGKEEKEQQVRAGGKIYRYRKETPEPFWAIDKQTAIWGIDKLEDFLDKLVNDAVKNGKLKDTCK